MRILVVEDERDLNLLLQKVLKKAGALKYSSASAAPNSSAKAVSKAA